MTIENTKQVGTENRSHVRAAGIVLAMGIAVLLSLPQAAFAQTATVCGPEVKEEVVKALSAVDNAPDDEKAGLYKELYAKYEYCLQDSRYVPQSFYLAAQQCGAFVSNLGSLFFEEMSCAGYDPQRLLFAAPVKIKQTFGFGPAPFPGSREHVLHCVADPVTGILLPVARDSVHLANAIPGQFPTWQFAVIARATQNLHTVLPLTGQTRRAKSILSWALPPDNCNYTPIWGNALNYRIRLDQ